MLKGSQAMTNKRWGLLRRAFRFMALGLANFVRMVRDDIKEAELDADVFYLCRACGYAHFKGSGCDHHPRQSPGGQQLP